jgi:hypothetical protein
MLNVATRVSTTAYDGSWTARLTLPGAGEQAERMVILGVRDCLAALVRFKDDVTSSEGGLWVAMMNGVLLIPLAIMGFFYPAAALAGLGAALACSVALLVAIREYHRRVNSAPGRDEMKARAGEPHVAGAAAPGLTIR